MLFTNHHKFFELFQSNFVVQVLKTLLMVSVKQKYEILKIKIKILKMYMKLNYLFDMKS